MDKLRFQFEASSGFGLWPNEITTSEQQVVAGGDWPSPNCSWTLTVHLGQDVNPTERPIKLQALNPKGTLRSVWYRVTLRDPVILTPSKTEVTSFNSYI